MPFLAAISSILLTDSSSKRVVTVFAILYTHIFAYAIESIAYRLSPKFSWVKIKSYSPVIYKAPVTGLRFHPLVGGIEGGGG